jgi:hypothetical protein
MTIEEFDNFDFKEFLKKEFHQCMYDDGNGIDDYDVQYYNKKERLLLIGDRTPVWVRCENVTILPF